MTETLRSYRPFAQIAEMPYRQAKHSVALDLYLNEKDIKNIKILIRSVNVMNGSKSVRNLTQGKISSQILFLQFP